jgi:hypothetical protein
MSPKICFNISSFETSLAWLVSVEDRSDIFLLSLGFKIMLLNKVYAIISKYIVCNE